MRTGWSVVADHGLGVLRARGADAITFLQGQLSNDAKLLVAGELQLSGYHSPQGRVIALLRLTPLAADDVLAVLPAELIPIVVTRLKKFVLRAKVLISDESAQWQLLGYASAPPAPLPPGAFAVRHGSQRYLVLMARAAGAIETGPDTGSRRDWAACDIADGLPQVYLATSEAFIAQMLNLDVTGGIAWDKGCYTGQEIIARAHYRGQVKRRMQRFVTQTPCELAPGQTGILVDGRGFRVVDAALQADGTCEFLAVTNPASAADGPGADRADAYCCAGETRTLVAAHELALPYAFPTPRRDS